MLGYFLKIFGRRAPKRTLIRDVRVGKVQCIEGDALAIGEPLVAPFSGTKCASMSVFHRYQTNVSIVESGRTRHVWSPDKEFVFRYRFYVRDESGLVRVQRCKRTQVFAHKFSTRKVPLDARVENLAAFRASFQEDEDVFAKFNESLRASTFAKARSHEVVIAQGSRVRIEGLVRNSGQPLPVDARVGFREAPTMLEFVAGPKKAMRITRIKRAPAQLS